jgi:hypothetical protein
MASDKAADWRRLDYRIAEEESAVDGLKKCRDALEVIIAACVTNKKTPRIINFRGKRRFLKSGLSEKEFHAAMALQFAYKAIDAIVGGDYNLALHMLAAFQKSEVEINNAVLHGTDSDAAFTGRAARREGSAKGGRATAKWTSRIEQLARPIFKDVRCNTDP